MKGLSALVRILSAIALFGHAQQAISANGPECPTLAAANSRLQARVEALLKRVPDRDRATDSEARSLVGTDLAVALANLCASRLLRVHPIAGCSSRPGTGNGRGPREG